MSNRPHMLRRSAKFLRLLLILVAYGSFQSTSLASSTPPGPNLYSSSLLVNQLSGLALADPASSTAAGTQMIQWPANGFTDQRWYARLQTGGYHLLVNGSSGLYLTAAGTTAGAAVQQAAGAGSDNQLWLATVHGSGYTLKNKAAGLYLDIGSGRTEGTGVVLAAYTGGTSQTWLNNNLTPTLNNSAKKYRITNLTTGLALADPASSTAAGTQMINFTGNGFADQLWCFCSNVPGGVTIQNTSSGLYLTDPGTSSPLLQEHYTGSSSQFWAVSQNAGGYVLQNLGTGRVVDGGANAVAGTGINNTHQNGSANQLWTVAGVGSIADGFYTLQNALSGLLLADPNSSAVSGTQMVQFVDNQYRDQSFQFSSQGSGYYSIRNAASGLLLGDLGKPALQQQNSAVDDAHLWYLTVNSANGYNILNKATGRAFDVGANGFTGSGVTLAPPSGNASQSWYFAGGGSSTVQTGTYHIVNSSTAFLLADPASSTAAGTQMIQWISNGFNDQNWNVVAKGSGYYTIQNAESNLYLTAPASSTGGALVQQPPNGSNYQLWSWSSSAGLQSIRNKATGQVIQPSSSAQGAGVLVAPSKGAAVELWNLQAGQGTPPYASTTSSFSFGQDLVGSAVTSNVGTVKNPGSTPITLTTSISGSANYTLVPAQSCGTQLAGGASCPLVVQYLPTTVGTQTASVQVIVSGPISGSGTVALYGTASGAPAASLLGTPHPLVAQYTIVPGFDASVTVDFGTDTTYGRSTPATATPSSGGTVNVLVAGMKANTVYHMRARITYKNGITLTNADQTFTTGPLPADLAAVKLTATTTPGLTPQAGVELLDPVNGGTPKPYAIDLQGNVIWYYPWPDYNPNSQIDGFNPMKNGHYLAVVGVLSSIPLTGVPPGATIAIREIDLLGNIVRQLTLADLNARLKAAGHNLTLADFHHDIAILPNGHWLVLANTLKTVSGVTILGDVVVDVDTNLNPVFVWNEFDHFDTNRRPMAFPDWTHSNAVVYTPDDGNFLVSIRHQNWVVKVNYNNGLGDGSVLWKLGYQGDFTLKGGTDPIDWQYAQHYPSFVGSASAGTFTMTLMDNGDDRIVPGGLCGVGSNQACYTSVPIFQINEGAKTATILWHRKLPTSLYSAFAGNAEVLANNDVEYDLTGIPTGSQVDEVMQDSSQTLVWTLKTSGSFQYRAFRIPSLYPGVQWPR